MFFSAKSIDVLEPIFLKELFFLTIDGFVTKLLLSCIKGLFDRFLRKVSIFKLFFFQKD
jgi:hypothetical protein